MKKILKVLNPFIWCINVFKYLAHLETYRYYPKKYDRYDFSKDLKYF